MTAYQFSLVITPTDLPPDEVAERLFSAGCDDATLSESEGVLLLDVDRDANGPAAAVVSAIDDVRAAGLDVERVIADDLVTLSEIAERTGRTRESIRLLAAGQRGPGGFPPPAERLEDRNKLWRWSAVGKWLADHDVAPITPVDPGLALVAEVANARLAERRAKRLLRKPDLALLRRAAG